MGTQASTRKSRVCQACKNTFHTSSKELKDHVATCKRLTALGLQSPGIIIPRLVVPEHDHTNR